VSTKEALEIGIAPGGAFDRTGGRVHVRSTIARAVL
jgi:hypothetical protein